jgi:hypothetical protein
LDRNFGGHPPGTFLYTWTGTLAVILQELFYILFIAPQPGTMLTLTLPDNTPVQDAVIVPNALQKWSAGEIDHSGVFERLSSVPKWPNDEEIPISDTGLEPILITGSHPALHYRGNALKRHKIWAQSDYASGMLKYGYTGWQHAVSAATRDVLAYPDLYMLMSWLNSNFGNWLSECGLPACDATFNHVIFTRYEDEKDFIGMHADKERDFVDGSYFVVFKLGCARDFAFSASDEIFWQQSLEAGTAIIVKTGSANQMCKHGVPVSEVPVGPSGSLVFRCIQTKVTWDLVRRNITRAKQQKKKRVANKKEKRTTARKTGNHGRRQKHKK